MSLQDWKDSEKEASRIVVAAVAIHKKFPDILIGRIFGTHRFFVSGGRIFVRNVDDYIIASRRIT